MAANVACIVGEGIHRQLREGMLSGEALGPRQTPFGTSGEVHLVTSKSRPFYLLCRYGSRTGKTAPSKINYRANLYALKDLGSQQVVSWAAGGAIVHEVGVGDALIAQDLIDRTYLRDRTFFEDRPLGYLRQFPVFCPALRAAACEALNKLDVPHRDGGVVAACEGPRLETPAEVRMLAGLGAEIATHAFAPEAFLAKELQLCYAAVCYVVSYAERGSAYEPFVPGRLFGAAEGGTDPVTRTVNAAGPAMAGIAEALEKGDKACECDKTMGQNIRQYGLSDDWRKWFK